MLTKGLTLKPELTAARLRELLHYDPETGAFTRRIAAMSFGGRSGRACQTAGAAVGTAACADGYVRFKVDGRSHMAHRLAWLYVHGNWPAEIDHRNGLRDDNRLSNLREVSRTLNNRNRHGARKDSGTGLIGAYRSSRPGKFRSGIHLDSGWKSLGTFDTPEAAHRAYMCAKAERDSAAG